MQHVNITVTGKVQGVFYRAHTKQQALALGLTGFVQNLPNGSVYIEAEGPAEQLQQLEQWCRKGPPNAVVTEVTGNRGEVVNFNGFVVKR